VKIVLATPTTLAGGVSRHVLDLAGGLSQAGDEVVLATPAAPQDVGPTGPFELVPFTASPRCDVWHLHIGNTFSRAGLDALVRSKRMASCSVLTEHLPRSNASDPRLGVHPRTFGAYQVKTAFKRLQYALCSGVIAVSSGGAMFIAERYGLAPGKIHTIPNGVRVPDAAKPPPEGSGAFVALGSIIDQKGFDVLIEAAEIAQEPWTVKVFGQGAHFAALDSRARRAASPRVFFEGWTADPVAAIDEAHALVAPSRWEASPYAALDAMAQGRPLVASSVDGLEDMVRSGTSGLLVTPNSPDALARALDSFATEPETVASFGIEARRTVENCFRLDQMITSTRNVYTGCLAR
jgi:glycosyltransferase involved in cell wall biosynthesis